MIAITCCYVFSSKESLMQARIAPLEPPYSAAVEATCAGRTNVCGTY